MAEESRERLKEDLSTPLEDTELDIDETLSETEDDSIRGADFFDDQCRGVCDFILTGEVIHYVCV
jgi:hypothetical protein